jgi:hypothetical protein
MVKGFKTQGVTDADNQGVKFARSSLSRMPAPVAFLLVDPFPNQLGRIECQETVRHL